MKVIYRMDAKFQDLKSSVQNIDVVIYRVNRKLFVENVVNVLLDNILKMNNVHCPSDALNAMIRLGDTGRLKFAHLQAKQRVHVSIHVSDALKVLFNSVFLTSQTSQKGNQSSIGTLVQSKSYTALSLQ